MLVPPVIEIIPHVLPHLREVAVMGAVLVCVVAGMHVV